MNIEELRESLSKGVCTVKFTKVSGEERIMKCTTNYDLLPQHEQKTESTRKFSDEATRVYDLEKQAWRSFRNDSVKDWTK